MKGDEEAAILCGKAIALIEGESQWGGMRLHLDQRLRHSIARLRFAKVGIDHVAGVAAWPAEIRAILERVDRLWRGVVTQQVASIVGGPDLPVPGIHRQPNRVAQAFREESPATAIRLIDPDGGAARVTFVADVATGADGDIELAVWTYQHS